MLSNNIINFVIQNNVHMAVDKSLIFNLKNENDFNDLALKIFCYQYSNCLIYKQYIDLLNIEPQNISHYKQFPFLPIEFFKTHIIKSVSDKPAYYFESSGTTGLKSRHYYNSTDIYERSFLKTFDVFYGKPEKYAILAYLPNYASNPNASLIYMLKALIQKSEHKQSGFYHNKPGLLFDTLNEMKEKNIPGILFGVTHALLKFCSEYTIYFPNLIIIETGGMKGHGKELVREELHQVLSKCFGVEHIHSEYGMTELFSQAYAKEGGIFHCPPWMKVLARDLYDPLNLSPYHKGALNIIDLANISSCSFIATEDMGEVYPDGSFTVTGRMDNSQLRGCNMM